MTIGFRKVFPPTPTNEEFAAIDAIRNAFLACNKVDTHTLEYQVSLGQGYDEDATAMGFLDAAGRTAWLQVGGPADIDFWGAMTDNGEDARYQWKLYLEGILEPGRTYA